MQNESYVVLNTLDSMHWLVTSHDGFYLFTEHNNDIFLLDSMSIVLYMAQTTVHMVFRRAVRISMHNYKCYHIQGEEND